MKEFSEKYTESGKAGQILINNYFRSIKRLLVEINLDVKKVLEVACGPGYSTRRLLDILPDEVDFKASDIEEENIEIAKKIVGNDVEIRKANIYSLDREDNSMDLIFALEVLEHLQYPENALREIGRVSKGYAIVAVPREPLWRVLNFARGKYVKNWGNTPGHIQHWNVKNFKDFIKNNGFEIVRMKYPLPWIQALIKKKR
jgi:2-polyprenyl-3-methyl-5-hydroxy-6-metoxy-1,4-benzoquinol methylase